VTSLQAGRLRNLSFISEDEKRFSFFSTTSRTFLGPTKFPIQRVLRLIFPGIKLQESETDYSPSSMSKLRMLDTIPPLLPHSLPFPRLPGVVLNLGRGTVPSPLRRGNCTFTPEDYRRIELI